MISLRLSKIKYVRAAQLSTSANSRQVAMPVKGSSLQGLPLSQIHQGETSFLVSRKKRGSQLRLSAFNPLIWTGRYFGLNKRWILDWSRGFGVIIRSSIVAKVKGWSCFESTAVGLARIGFLFKRAASFGDETLLESIR